MSKKLDDELYYVYRRMKGLAYSMLMKMCYVFPIKKNKIVVCCHKGSRGYGCNPKYIVENLCGDGKDYDIIWLVKDMKKNFPKKIKKVRYTFLNSAYHLATAKIWIDNDKKELGTVKRKGQFYIHTWHGPIGFKTCGAFRGKSWSKLSRVICKKDSGMTDVYLSNSDWCSKTHRKAFLYKKEVIFQTGMPRTDALLNRQHECREGIRKRHNLPWDSRILIFAPTFRGGIQNKTRKYEIVPIDMDLDGLREVLRQRFGGEWYIMLRLHPLIAASTEKYPLSSVYDHVMDISQQDDLYEYIAAADAFLSDYSSCAFDASYMYMPVFLYARDRKQFAGERAFYWKEDEIPFPVSENFDKLKESILGFEESAYRKRLDEFFKMVNLCEKGNASEKTGDMIRGIIWGKDDAK